MKKLSAIFLLSLACSASAQSGKLNLFIWSEYIDPQIVKQFEKEFGCKVTLDVYEDAESMLAKIQGGACRSTTWWCLPTTSCPRW